jgi:transcriptional regulator with XRE-family HTH domain
MPNINPDHAKAIGEKLRTVRLDHKMSLRELAQKAAISASMLSQIETGKTYPSVRSIYNIATALAVPVDYFFPDLQDIRNPSLEADLNTAEDLTASEMREAQMNQSVEPPAAESIPRSTSSPVVRCEVRPTIELKGGVKWARLTALAETGAEFLEITYDPGAMSGKHMSHHEGREFGLILEGELVVELGFESYSLRKGDSIIFESTIPHRLFNNSSQITRAVWVVLNAI